MIRILNKKEIQNKENAVSFDKDIWKKIKAMSCYRQMDLIPETDCIPVVNVQKEIIGIAFQDSFANREMRMLRELQEIEEALTFRDIYEEYESVSIYGCNELAYEFAHYLIRCGVTVNVYGELWEGLGEWQSAPVDAAADYKIYAEGTWTQGRTLLEQAARSVSVEFECIDMIYRENLKRGIIKEAYMEKAELIKCLQEECSIVLMGTDQAAQDTYDFLLGEGIDICAFMGENSPFKGLLGKEVLSFSEIEKKYRNPVFIDCKNKNSAWGFGETDNYDYLGYRRNESFYFIQDYAQIPMNCLQHVVKNKRLVLVGDAYRAKRVYAFLKQKNIEADIRYAGMSLEFFTLEASLDMPQMELTDVGVDDICLLVYPLECHYVSESNRLTRYKEKLADLGICDCSDYFSMYGPAIVMEQHIGEMVRDELRPAGIIVGAIPAFSGNILFRDIMDGHPNVLMLNYSFLNDNLFGICTRLAEEKGMRIISLLKEMISDDDLFYRSMGEYIREEEVYTSLELFILIHMAAARANRAMDDVEIKKMFIYWEPHQMSRSIVRQYAGWMSSSKWYGGTVTLVRNEIMRRGSAIKCLHTIVGNPANIETIMIEDSVCEDRYADWESITIRFEDLKCYPKEMLNRLCEKIGLPWSATLLETTRNGKQAGYLDVTGFDLRPVYNNYEEFLSAFDRMRIILLNLPWQETFRYPCVDIRQFSMKELQEMFLKSFRIFEIDIPLKGDQREKFLIQQISLARKALDKALYFAENNITYHIENFMIKENEKIEEMKNKEIPKEEILEVTNKKEIQEFVSSSENDVIVYGTGIDASLIWDMLSERDREKLIFCDKRASSETYSYQGKKVLSPDKILTEYKENRILVSTRKFGREIRWELLLGDIPKDNIMCVK